MSNIDQYAKTRQLELARCIRDSKKIYLDTRFWIIVRDVSLGIDVRPTAVELTNVLRMGVTAGRLICPISESTFIEVLKQAQTPSRRQATASLIDELSGGVSLTTGRTRIATEIAHFFYRNSGQTNLHDLQELVWTKLSYAMGYLHPMIDDLEPSTMLRLQRKFFDVMWDTPLSEIMKSIDANTMDGEAQELSAVAAEVDAQIKAHEVELVSFKKVYRDEVIGAIDISEALVLDVLNGMAEQAGFIPAPENASGKKEVLNVARNLLVHAFERSLAQGTLRTIHALASLHAGLRWNKRTTFNENHFFDFEHAAGAVAYCDAFFTEGFLSNLINAGHMRLDRINNCRTTNELSEAVEILRQM